MRIELGRRAFAHRNDFYRSLQQPLAFVVRRVDVLFCVRGEEQ